MVARVEPAVEKAGLLAVVRRAQAAVEEVVQTHLICRAALANHPVTVAGMRLRNRRNRLRRVFVFLGG